MTAQKNFRANKHSIIIPLFKPSFHDYHISQILGFGDFDIYRTYAKSNLLHWKLAQNPHVCLYTFRYFRSFAPRISSFCVSPNLIINFLSRCIIPESVQKDLEGQKDYMSYFYHPKSRCSEVADQEVFAEDGID